MSDESNDVTKALAAFGAPLIRYHSFGQAQNRPTGVTLPRQPVAATLPPEAPVGEPSPILTQQTEPVAAPEGPLAGLAPYPAPMPPVVPQPMPTPTEPPTIHPAPLFAPEPMVAPPPRPLAEWAAPVVSPTIRPAAVPVVPPVPAPNAGAPSLSSPEVGFPAPPMSPPVPQPAIVTPSMHAPEPHGPDPVLGRPPAWAMGLPSATASLPEVFEYLAAG